MGLELSQEAGVEHVLVVANAGEGRESGGALVIQAPFDTETDRLEIDVFRCDAKNRPRIEAARQREAQSFARTSTPMDGVHEARFEGRRQFALALLRRARR